MNRIKSIVLRSRGYIQCVSGMISNEILKFSVKIGHSNKVYLNSDKILEGKINKNVMKI